MKLLLGFILTALIFALPATTMAATLSLSPSTGTVNKGCNISLKIELDTQDLETDGTDAIIIYDTSRFTATGITSGTIYPDYPGNTISTDGKIVVSGLASVTTPFKGKGTLATVILTANQSAPTGASQLRFDFDPNDKTKTTDSNVVQRGTVTDVLTAVTDANLTVGTGTSCAGGQGQTTTTTLGGSTGTGSAISKGGVISGTDIPLKELPKGGIFDQTIIFAGVGTVLTILGIIGLAML